MLNRKNVTVLALPLLVAVISCDVDTALDNEHEVASDVLDDDLEAIARQYAQLRVDVGLGRATYQNDESPTLTVTYTNQSGAPMRIYTAMLPSPDFWGNAFLVTLDGEAVSYVGRMVRRAEPTTADFVDLEAGESVVGAIDLSRLYDFSRTGHYEVQFTADAQKIGYYASPEHAQIVSNSVTAYVEARPAALPEAIPVPKGSDLAFLKCSASEQADVRAAMRNARTYVADAKLHLAGIDSPGGASRYSTWFGAYDQARGQKVLKSFSKMKSAFNTQTINFRCNCNMSGVYAWVYPSEPYVITVCDAFWRAPVAGHDSKADTIIHEMSHFNVVGGTDDHVYGVSGCKKLAKRSPRKAVDNADSHAYFCSLPNP